MAGSENLGILVENENQTDPVNAQDDNERNERIVKFPMTRIKTIIKTDPEVTMASQDAVVLISKATVSQLSARS